MSFNIIIIVQIEALFMEGGGVVEKGAESVSNQIVENCGKAYALPFPQSGLETSTVHC
jgi:hypothetical protein